MQQHWTSMPSDADVYIVVADGGITVSFVITELRICIRARSKQTPQRTTTGVSRDIPAPTGVSFEFRL